MTTSQLIQREAEQLIRDKADLIVDYPCPICGEIHRATVNDLIVTKKLRCETTEKRFRSPFRIL